MTGDLRFLVSEQTWKKMYAWQWLYLPVLYGFLGFLTRIQDVAATWLAKSSGPIRVNYYGDAWLRIFATKGFWAAWRIAVPLLVWKVPAATFWPLFAVSEICTGFYLAWNFEVSHISGEVEWPAAKGVNSAAPNSAPPTNAMAKGDVGRNGGILPRPWAESQIATGVDYAHNSWAAAFWSGALNYQIEHHLFPGISQYHYPAIADIVKKAAQEYKIPYRLEPSFWAAWCAHVRYLHAQGAKGIQVKMD